MGGKRLTTEDFITRAREKHGDRYMYDRAIYTGSGDKIEIGCRAHGYFWQSAKSHLSGSGCQRCYFDSNIKSTEQFITDANQVHGDRYLYDKTIYKKGRDKIEIGCRIEGHGYFLQRADTHLEGKGCPKCGGSMRRTTHSFIQDAIRIHENKYNYDQVSYIDSRSNVDIICNIHGLFSQRPDLHLAGHGCINCQIDKHRGTTEEFIRRATERHGDRYDYSQSVYISAIDRIDIRCSVHDMFSQAACEHLRGRGCPKCATNQFIGTEEFIRRAHKTHGDRYDYSKVEYTGYDQHVDIICKIHGVFQQAPYNHVRGSGCPSCKKKSEAKVLLFLQEILPDEEIIHDKVWKEVYGTRRPDFRIPRLKLIVEYNGEQHYRQVPNRKDVDLTQRIDIWKTLKAMYAGYSVLHIRYDFIERSNWREYLKKYIRIYDNPSILWAGNHIHHEEIYNQCKANIDDVYI